MRKCGKLYLIECSSVHKSYFFQRLTGRWVSNNGRCNTLLTNQVHKPAMIIFPKSSNLLWMGLHKFKSKGKPKTTELVDAY